jgi:hypothetical protein
MASATARLAPHLPRPNGRERWTRLLPKWRASGVLSSPFSMVAHFVDKRHFAAPSERPLFQHGGRSESTLSGHCSSRRWMSRLGNPPFAERGARSLDKRYNDGANDHRPYRNSGPTRSTPRCRTLAPDGGDDRRERHAVRLGCWTQRSQPTSIKLLRMAAQASGTPGIDRLAPWHNRPATFFDICCLFI